MYFNRINGRGFYCNNNNISGYNRRNNYNNHSPFCYYHFYCITRCVL